MELIFPDLPKSLAPGMYFSFCSEMALNDEKINILPNLEKEIEKLRKVIPGAIFCEDLGR